MKRALLLLLMPLCWAQYSPPLATLPLSIANGGTGSATGHAADAPWLCAPTSASGTTYTCTPTTLSGAAIPLSLRQAPVNGQQMIFVPDVNSTGNVTIQIDGVNNRSLCKQYGNCAAAGFGAGRIGNGDISGGGSYPLFFYSTTNRWIVVTTVVAAGSGIAFGGTFFSPSIGLDSTQLGTLAGFQSGGTKFTTSGAGCTVTGTAGGATAGSFTTSTTGTCTTTITMNGATGLAANTGWVCSGGDITSGHLANLLNASGGSTTTAVLQVATTSGDTVAFSCGAY
jgi:hypothetical protein